jgi:nudix-type nucleoside diphosphatase (YffH/AdpP family)
MSEERVKIREVKTLSDDWYVLKKTTFDFRRKDGSWQTLNRETYDRGNGAVILLVDRIRRKLILTRQFRFPAFVNGQEDGMLIEACAGLLDQDDAASAILRETEEETGFRVTAVRKIFDLFMSPGSVTERLHFFVGEYELATRSTNGGGAPAEGEEIEVLELGIEEAWRMVGTGEIRDGKTIILLQHCILQGW